MLSRLSSALVLVAGAASIVGCGGDIQGDTFDDSAIDSGIDVTVTDAMFVPADAGMVDTYFDAGNDPRVPAVPLGQRLCRRLAVCCGASTFDMKACLANPPLDPVVADLAAIEPFFDGGHITFDNASAESCFSKLDSVSCGSITGAFITDLIQTCYARAKGNVLVGDPCRGSPECAPPSHCEVVADASACVSPRDAGAACATHDQCGQLLSGIPGYCDTSANNFGGNDTCQPQKDLDAGCREGIECQSNICSTALDPALQEAGAGQCASTFAWVTLQTCESYQLHD